jgi:hypothetical protein
MAIRTDDVALVYLGGEDLSRPERRGTGGKSKRLFARYPVIEIHLIRREHVTTVCARHRTSFSQERDCSGLPVPNTQYLCVAMPNVVRDIRKSLARTLGHTIIIERMFCIGRGRTPHLTSKRAQGLHLTPDGARLSVPEA